MRKLHSRVVCACAQRAARRALRHRSPFPQSEAREVLTGRLPAGLLERWGEKGPPAAWKRLPRVRQACGRGPGGQSSVPGWAVWTRTTRHNCTTRPATPVSPMASWGGNQWLWGPRTAAVAPAALQTHPRPPPHGPTQSTDGEPEHHVPASGDNLSPHGDKVTSHQAVFTQGGKPAFLHSRLSSQSSRP